jgi:drug/metabolite transporter (DMT)-like permease
MIREQRNIQGAMLFLGSSVLFCLASSLVKIECDRIDPLHLVVGRFAIGALLMLVLHGTGRIVLGFDNKRLLLVRGLAGGLAIYLNFILIQRMGLAKSTMLLFLYPFFASILGVVFLRERFPLINLVAILIAGYGLILLVGGSGRLLDAWAAFGIDEGLAVFAALLSGVVVITIRKLHDTDNSWTIYCAQCFVGLVLFAPLAGWKSWSGTGFDVGMMILIGVVATIGQLMMTEGFKYLPVRVGSLMGMTDPLFGYLAGLVLFREPVTLMAVVGAMMILVSCGMVLAWRK